MSNVPNSSFFLIPITSRDSVVVKKNALARRLYQRIELMEAFEKWGRALATVGEQARAFRDFHLVRRTSDVLLRLPFSAAHKAVGHYFRGLANFRLGSGDLVRANNDFERAIIDCPPAYKARAILSLGATVMMSGDRESELALYLEATKAASLHDWCDPLTSLTAARAIAIWKAREGSHEAALCDLERTFPLAQALAKTSPYAYLDYLNSMAVELISLKRFNEAEAAMRMVLASPFAHCYPEWNETGTTLRELVRSTSRSAVYLSARRSGDEFSPVPLGGCEGNVVYMDAAPRIAGQGPAYNQAARVLSFSRWSAMSNRRGKGHSGGRLSEKDISELTFPQKQTKIIELLVGEADDEQLLDAILAEITPIEKERRIMGEVLSSTITEDTLDRILRLFVSRQAMDSRKT